MSLSKTLAAERTAELLKLAASRWSVEVFRRFQCVWLGHVMNLSARGIAEGLGLNVSTVRRIQSEFERHGVKAIEGKGNRGGRRNQYLDLADEAAFLREHADLFDRSGVADVAALQEAFTARVGRSVHRTTLYRMIERHRKRPSAAHSRAGGQGSGTSARKHGARDLPGSGKQARAKDAR